MTVFCWDFSSHEIYLETCGLLNLSLNIDYRAFGHMGHMMRQIEVSCAYLSLPEFFESCEAGIAGGGGDGEWEMWEMGGCHVGVLAPCFL